MTVSGAVQGVLTILTVMTCGYILSRRFIISEGAEQALTAVLARFAVPVLMFRNGYLYMTPDFLGEMGLWLLLPAGIILVMMGASVLLCRVLHMREESRGLIAMMSSLSNVLYLGIPVITAIFGDSGIPYIMAYNISNTVICWTLGEMGIAADAGRKVKFWAGFLKSLIAPAMVGMYLGIAFAFTGLSIPAFVGASAGYISRIYQRDCLPSGAAYCRGGSCKNGQKRAEPHKGRDFYINSKRDHSSCAHAGHLYTFTGSADDD